MTWQLEGTYFEACSCALACPCVMLSAPTEGECRALIAWHVERGRDGEVDLAGLNVAIAVHSPGHMMETKWQAALYLDERASAAQKDALTRIFAGQAGGHPAVLASFVGEVLGVASGEVTISGHPLCVVPGEPAVVAKSSRLAYSDHAMTWAISDCNGFYSPFAYQGG